MAYRIEEVKVGLVVVLSVVLLVGFVAVISGVHWHRETVRYTTRLDWVGGLEVGTPVRLGGVRVGRIAEVVPPTGEDRSIQLVLEVARGTPIKTDSRAYMTSIGIMGEFYVEIAPGSPESPLLPPGSEIPSLPSTTFSQLSQRLGEMSGDLKGVLQNLEALLDPGNPAGVSALVQNLNQTVTAQSAQIGRLAASLDSALGEIRQLAATLRGAMQQNRQALNHSVMQLDSVLVHTAGLVRSLERVTQTVDATVLESSGQLNDIVQNLQRATRNLEAFSQEIRQRPWSLVRKSYPKPRELPE